MRLSFDSNFFSDDRILGPRTGTFGAKFVLRVLQILFGPTLPAARRRQALGALTSGHSKEAQVLGGLGHGQRW